MEPPRYHDVPIFITCRDRISDLLELIAWLEEAGYDNLILVDNDSTYLPLIIYYKQTKHQVIRLGENVGHRAVWKKGLINKARQSQYIKNFYVVTDCDIIPSPECPTNVIEHFYNILLKYQNIEKIGFGLRIDDIPSTFKFKSEVEIWESQFWTKEIEPGVFDTAIDTTFALYKPGTYHNGPYTPALRTGAPYIAKHGAWYIDSNNLSEEEKHYRTRVSLSINSWNRDELNSRLVYDIDQLRKVTP